MARFERVRPATGARGANGTNTVTNQNTVNPGREEEIIRPVSLEEKKQKEKKIDIPPPPKSKVDVERFVKPVVTKEDEVEEEIVVMKDIAGKIIGSKDMEGDPTAVLTVDIPSSTGDVTDGDIEKVYTSDALEVKPEFPGGMAKFYKFVGDNYQTPEEEGLKGKVYITFIVEKDGSLTDIKVVRDIGYGTGKEAIRVLNKCPKWMPGEQNGKKVRVLYSLPITIQSAE